jgi:P27 family predicted phage terminase small subunit
MPYDDYILSERALALREQVLDAYDLSPAETAVLDKGLEALDTADQAQAQVAEHGVLIQDRFGQLVRNPAVGIAKDARAQFLAAVKQLGLADPYGGEAKQGRGAQRGRS